MDDRAALVVPAFALLTGATLVLLFFVARSRAAFAGRVVSAGVILALFALWYGLLTGVPTRDHQAMPFGNAALGEILLRIAAMMILGGIVLGLLARDQIPVPPNLPERPADVPPSV
jgi:hypothetical protein